MSDMRVVELSGQAWVRDENGNLQEIQQGDVIDSNQTVVTADNASLTLSSPDGQTVQVPAGAEVTLTSVLEAAEEEVESSEEDSGEDDSGREESGSPNEEGEADESQNEGSERPQSNEHPDHEGQSFTRVNRIEELVDPLDYEYGLDTNDGPDVRWGGAAEEDEEDEEDNAADVTQPFREAPGVSVELQGAGDDDTYNQDEIGEDGSVTAQVTLEDGTEVGDTLTVTDKDGNELVNRPVTQDDLDNGVSVEVPVSPGDPETSVSATVTDPAGNSSSDDDQTPIDNVPPVVSVELQGAGDDDTYNQDEIGEDGTVTAQVTLEDGTEVGDTLTVTDKDGNVLDEREVTQDDLDNGVSVEVPVEPGDPNTSVSATVTDPTGNSSSDDDQKPIDNVPPAVSVELTGSGEDGTYNQDEIGEDGSITAQVTLEDGTEVGDTLTVTDKDGNVLDEREVTQDDLENGVSVEVPVEPGDPETSVSATVTDPTGNSSSDDDQKPIDNVPPAVSVELTGSGEDDTYNQDEIGEDGSVTAQVTLEDGTEVGDTLTVTDKGGNTLEERTVTQDDLDNGVSVEVPVEPGDPNTSVSATVTDPTGNSSSDDDQKPIDNVPPAVSVELQGAGDDDTYSQDEIGDDGSVTAQVTLEDGTEVGDTLTVTDKDGNVLDDHEVTQDDLDNGVSVEVPVEPGVPNVSVNAKVTDPAGNSDSDDDQAPIDWDVAVDVPNEHGSTDPDGNFNDQVVFESGLGDGSAPNTADTRVESSFTLTALDGLQDDGAVSLAYTNEDGEEATLELSKAEVEALGDTSQTLTTEYGELSLDGYSQADDGTITLDYDYVLTNAPTEDVDNLMDNITVAATDVDGSTDSSDLNIKIVDDAPVAEDDTNSVTEDSATTTTTGNVLGDSGASDGDVADAEGADGATVTAVESTNVPANDADAADGTLTIDGEYGALTLNADGSYSYTLDNTNLDVQGLSDGETLDEVFSYTLTDGDSDADNANLTITIEGSDDDVTVNVPNDHDSTTPDGEIGDQVVFESGLDNGSATNAADTQVESSFTLTALDGLQETGAVTLDYTDENGESATLSLSKAEVEALGGTSQTLTTQYGELTLNGYSQADDGTITLDYDYLLTNAPEEDVDNLMDSATVTATDEDGSTDNGDLNIQVVDDAPTAEDDTNSVTEGDDTASTVETSGNVIGGGDASSDDAEDTEGADGATVTAVESTNVPGNSASGTDTLVIDGEYGTLTIEADGSYTYALDNTNLDVQGLGDDDTLTEAFTYTLTDGDTDSDDATLTITIDGSDDGVTVDVPNDNDATTPDGNINDQVVFESGLTDGSAPNTADTRVESSFTLTALDGLQDNGAISLAYTNEDGEEATLELSKAEVEALGDTSQTLTTEYGELSLDGYSQADDGTITLDYDYVLTNAPDADVDALMDSVTVTATDRDGQTDNGDLNIKIVDDAPVAEDDTNSVTEDSATTTTTGNVLGDSGASGGDVADDEGADGATVTAVTSTNVPANDADETGGTLTIDGEYGTLTLEADGSYSYVLDNDNLDVQGLSDGETLDEVFSYTLTDGDSDADNANLTIAIEGSDDGVTVNVPNDNDATTPDGDTSDQVVFESGLADGSEPNADDIRVESSFTLTALDGLQETSAVTLGYTDEDGDPATLSLSKAEVEALGDTSQTLTTQYGELTLNGYSQVADGTITLDYDYTLERAPSVGGDDVTDNIDITATDEDGSTDSGDLDIKIVDDAPTANADTGTVEEDGSALDGNVLTTTEAGPGDVADTQGADGATVTGFAVGNQSSELGDNVGSELVGDYGTLTLDDDGTYTYVVDNDNADVNALKDGDSLTETFSYTIQDADGDWSTTTLTLTVEGNTDGTPAITPDDGTPDVDGEVTVSESGLSDGSEADSDNESAGGTLSVNAADGLSSLTIGGTTLDLAALNALSDSDSQTINVEGGTLELTGFAATSNVGDVPTEGELSYTYTLTEERTHSGAEDDALTLEIPLSVTDAGEASSDGTLTVRVEDDTPTAEDDTAVTVTEGESATTGNVLDNDTPGADGAYISQITYTDRDGNEDDANIAEGDSVSVDTLHGELTVESNGDWSYTPLASADHSASEDDASAGDSFDYVLTDGDGDESEPATQPIEVEDTEPEVGTAENASVNESGLDTGTGGDSSMLTGTGSLEVTDAQDSIDTTFDSGNQAALEALGLTSQGNDLSYTVSDDGHTITATAGIGGDTVFTLTITDPTDSSAGYEFTLDGPLDHVDEVTNGDGNIKLPVDYTVTDSDGDTDNGNFTVTVVDNTPTDAEESIVLDEDGSHELSTPANATEDNITFGTDPQYGTVDVATDGTLTYTPDEHYSGADSFTYRYTEGGEERTVTVDVTVNPVADAPTLTVDSDSVQTLEDESIP
ncbi:VCBS domain-containing protein, partial [Halomonas halmophila]|uniref:VCBS domain-containing protein n=1 Tax=Halomonas halmophila TaxID=252 RepID=UPI001C3FED44